MPSRHEILCISKGDRPNPDERILSIGGRKGYGSTRRVSQQEAILGIESLVWEFFVRHHGREVGGIVAVSRYGHKYLKTRPDVEQPNNLLSLPECR